jgi:hypothetical protein
VGALVWMISHASLPSSTLSSSTSLTSVALHVGAAAASIRRDAAGIAAGAGAAGSAAAGGSAQEQAGSATLQAASVAASWQDTMRRVLDPGQKAVLTRLAGTRQLGVWGCQEDWAARGGRAYIGCQDSQDCIG